MAISALLLSVAGLVTIASCCYSAYAFNESVYSFSVDLSADYKLALLEADRGLHLHTGRGASVIVQFGVKARTQGFVGLGISEVGSMKGSDLMVGTVNDNQALVLDYFAYNQSREGVLLDFQQDVITLSGEQSADVNGTIWTSLEFKRSLYSTDCNDRNISIGQVNLVWSFGPSDDLAYHGPINRGSKTIRLYGPGAGVVLQEAASPVTFVTSFENYTVPVDFTTYVCKKFVSPFKNKRHAIHYEPQIRTPEPSTVHHMVLYSCTDQEFAALADQFDCLAQAIPCAKTILAWAIGGLPYDFPSAAGLPFGPGGYVNMVLEMHYTNPSSISGVVDSSGLKFTFSDKLRDYDAGTWPLGPTVAQSLVIPPGMPSWTVKSKCSLSCTKKLFKYGPITVISSLLHQHLIGKSLWTSLTRNGTFVKYLNRADYYDFAFQQTSIFPTPLRLQAGDVLETTCVWDSTGRVNNTVGGLATTDEMCLHYLTYYPASLDDGLSGCDDTCIYVDDDQLKQLQSLSPSDYLQAEAEVVALNASVGGVLRSKVPLHIDYCGSAPSGTSSSTYQNTSLVVVDSNSTCNLTYQGANIVQSPLAGCISKSAFDVTTLPNGEPQGVTPMGTSTPMSSPPSKGLMLAPTFILNGCAIIAGAVLIAAHLARQRWYGAGWGRGGGEDQIGRHVAGKGAAAAAAAQAPAQTPPPFDGSDYAYGVRLADSYSLFWKLTDNGSAMQFGVRVRTSGFVGLGISEVGSMKGSDLMVGHVKDGEAVVLDYFAYNQSLDKSGVLLDIQQDVTTISGEESTDANGTIWTYLEFKRPLVTGDCNDRDIDQGQVHLIWSFGSADELAYHGLQNRGSQTLRLYGPGAGVMLQGPASPEVYNITVKNLTLSPVYTTYTCKRFVVPFEVKRHVVGVAPLIRSSAPQTVHHMILYSCTDEEWAGLPPGDPFDCIKILAPCIRSVVGWAIGGLPFEAPPLAGLPFGPGGNTKLVLETHYTNPTGLTGVVDSSGLALTLSDKLRKYDAGTWPIGPTIAKGLRIPPVFASLLHQHLIGKSIWTSLYRNGNFVQYINRADYYDFSFQQLTDFAVPVQVQAGDVLETTCVWDSTGRVNDTLGGPSTLDEMCLHYLAYYPASLNDSLTGCDDACLDAPALLAKIDKLKETSPELYNVTEYVIQAFNTSLDGAINDHQPLDVDVCGGGATSASGAAQNINLKFNKYSSFGHFLKLIIAPTSNRTCDLAYHGANVAHDPLAGCLSKSTASLDQVQNASTLAVTAGGSSYPPPPAPAPASCHSVNQLLVAFLLAVGTLLVI
eukprot:SM000011S19143  [mRNA]  locus=s11:1092824:1103117:+ [translate_table: standard]